MKKKFIITLIAVCTMLFAFCMINASAATVDSGTCGNNLTWTLDDEGTLTISGAGAMNQYAGTYSKSPWNGNNSITAITIGNDVTSIGSYAFYKCTGLVSVTIGDNVKTIGKNAFFGCNSLISTDIGDNVKTIDESAFEQCTSLINVNIPESVTNINYNAFYECSALKKVDIADIESWCNIEFMYQANPLPYAKNLYLNGDLITQLIIPEGTTKINAGAFEGCEGLISVTIPSSITTIKTGAFQDCTALTRVDITDIASWCNIEFGPYDANPLLEAQNLYLNNNLVTDLVIPNGVTNISGMAFHGCESLTSVTIPNTVTSIGSRAFSMCRGLTSLLIPDSVTSIGEEAFWGCNNLINVIIGSGIETIPEGAFWCELSSNLKYVALPAEIKYIRNDAFNGCPKIETVFYAGSESQWNEILFYSRNENLTNAKIIYNATKKIYKFETNCDNGLEDITDYAIFTMPTVENDGMTLSGWYDNAALTGEPVTFPYYGDATTLYAAWTDRTGKSFEDAFIAKANQEYTVTTTESGQLVYFEFVPNLSKEYRFYTTGSNDTYGYLYDSKQSRLTSDDDDGDGKNFYISYNLTAGETYYIAAKLYSGTGTFTFVVEEPMDYRINEITIKDMSGNSLQAIPTGTFLATVSFTNVSSSADTVIILAQYTDAGVFKGLMYIQTEDVPTGSTIKLSIPVDNSNGDVAKLKAFSWESFNALTPMGNSASFPAE